MRELRADQLTKRKVKVEDISVTVRKKIGEGGSAFVYLARSFSALNDTTSNISSNEVDSTTDESFVDGTQKGDSGSSKSGHKKKRTQMGIGRGRNRLLRKSKGDLVVLKTMLLGNKELEEQAKNEVKMLQLLSSHPNIVNIYAASSGPSYSGYDYRMYFLLMEYCRGGSLMNLIMKQRWIREQQQKLLQQQQEIISSSKRTQIPSSISRSSSTSKKLFKSKKRSRQQEIDEKLDQLSGGFLSLNEILGIYQQVCDAVAYMHNRFQITDDSENEALSGSENGDEICTLKTDSFRVPIVHRDLKPENILLVHPRNQIGCDKKSHSWQCKLCDFGSAVEGRVPLTTRIEREKAREKIERSTTQMYRAPEMIDLHMRDELTEKTDIWALGCSIYTTAFLQNCFDENANLRILSGNFDFPEEHPYGHHELFKLIKRMIVVDPSKRANIDEVLECINAIQSLKPLPSTSDDFCDDASKTNRDNISKPVEILSKGNGKKVSSIKKIHKKMKGKKLNPSSEAARRKQRHKKAWASDIEPPTSFDIPSENIVDFSPFKLSAFEEMSNLDMPDNNNNPFVDNQNSRIEPFLSEEFVLRKPLISFDTSSVSDSDFCSFTDDRKCIDFTNLAEIIHRIPYHEDTTDASLVQSLKETSKVDDDSVLLKPFDVRKVMTYPPQLSPKHKDLKRSRRSSYMYNSDDINDDFEFNLDKKKEIDSLRQSTSYQESIEVQLQSDKELVITSNTCSKDESSTIKAMNHKSTIIGSFYMSRLNGLKLKIKGENENSTYPLILSSGSFNTCPLSTSSSCSLQSPLPIEVSNIML